MKLLPGEFQKILQAIPVYTHYIERDGTQLQVTPQDLINYVNDLEQKLVRLAAKVADTL